MEETIIEEGTQEYEYLEKAQNVEVRDGDDLINISVTDETTDEDINYNEEVEPTLEDGEEYTPNEEVPELKPTEQVEDVVTKLEANRQGFEEMVGKAIESEKVTASDIEFMMKEYEDSGKLSEATLDKLAEAGYPRSFVEAYIQGQEALANQYQNEVYNFVGGKDNFDKYVDHLQRTSPATVDALENAIVNCDMTSIKGILQLTRESMATKFGRKAERSVVRQTTNVQAPKQIGYGSKQELVAAMSDARYGRDTAYTREVEQKVLHTNLF